MFRDYWKMSDGELKKLARRYHMQGFLEEKFVLTDDRKFESDFVINRRDVIDQLSQRDTKVLAYNALVLSIIAILVSLISLLK
jgi:hypothetical protein